MSPAERSAARAPNHRGVIRRDVAAAMELEDFLAAGNRPRITRSNYRPAHGESEGSVYIQVYPDTDALAGNDFTLEDDRGGADITENHHYFTGPSPTSCIDECFADPHCHGFVTVDNECFFRGGHEENPDTLKAGMTERPGFTLFIISGDHDAGQSAWELQQQHKQMLVTSGAVALLVLGLAALAFYFYYKKYGKKELPFNAVTGSLVYSEEKGLLGSDKGVMYLMWHMTSDPVDQRKLASFTTDQSVPAHRLVHPGNRVALVRNVKEKKDVYSGWTQYLMLAHKNGGTSVSHEADIPGREVVLTAVKRNMRVLRCRAGSSLEIGEAQAVATAATASQDLNIKHMDLAPFIQLGNKVGVAVEIGGAPSPSIDNAPTPRCPGLVVERLARTHPQVASRATCRRA